MLVAVGLLLKDRPAADVQSSRCESAREPSEEKAGKVPCLLRLHRPLDGFPPPSTRREAIITILIL